MPYVCTIVGAGPGLGAALARRFAAGGFRIALIGRRREALDAVIRSMAGCGESARGFPADAGRPESISAAFQDIGRWAGDSEMLIYNAAVLDPGNASTLSPARFLADMSVNVGGALGAVSEVLPAMRRRRRGTIILTGGGLALEPYPEWASLAAGKAALRSFAIALHKEVAAEGVHVAVIAICGIIETGSLFDPDRITEVYWSLHAQKKDNWQRELVYLPSGADPFYNDPRAIYRAVSLPFGRTPN